MTIATGKPLGRPKKLSDDQHRVIAERSLMHTRLRLEAAKHSPAQLAKEFGVTEQTIVVYLNRKLG